MYIYEYGAIGETIRTKIDNFKSRVRGGESSSDSFGQVLKSYLDSTDNETKVVSATGSNTLSSEKGTAVNSISGSNLLYAIQNSGEDTTAGAVLTALGFSGLSDSGSSSLKNAADSLSASAEQLMTINGSGAQNITAMTDFVSDYNKLMTMLGAESSSSAYMYKNAFSAMLHGSAEALGASGISFENGYMSYEGGGNPLPSSLLGNIASTASLVSSYAGTVSDSEDGYNGVSEYYSALMSSML